LRHPSPKPSRCGVFRFPAPTENLCALAVFIASRLRSVRLVYWKRRPRESFATGFFAVTYRARHPGCCRSLAGIFRPGDAHGIYISYAALLRFPGDDAFRRLAPTCRFACRITASFIVAGFIQYWMDHGSFGCGFWGLAPRSSRAVLSAGPAIAFAHRAERLTCRCCLGLFPLSGFYRRPRATASRAIPPGLSFDVISASAVSGHGDPSIVPTAL
jgi:hypothetical protein